HARTPADGPAACPQSPVRQGACESRARVPGRQMPVRLSQGTLSRPRQEWRAGVLVAGACQPVSRPQDDCVRLTQTAPRGPCACPPPGYFKKTITLEHTYGRKPLLIRGSLAYPDAKTVGQIPPSRPSSRIRYTKAGVRWLQAEGVAPPRNPM